MIVHLVDATYELFRQHFGSAAHHTEPTPFAATIGVLGSTITLLEQGATHVALASDHVIESFRNELWPGYKTSEGMLPELLHQIPLMEEAAALLGVTVWPMVEVEADDALASAARVAEFDERVSAVVICTPDKDLGQCVRGTRVVQLDRRNDTVIDEAGVRAKFGVLPASIPDWLALVGDSADGFPGLPGWGAKSASGVLAVYEHLEAIPASPGQWEVPGVRGVPKLAHTLQSQFDLALLFRRLATCDVDVVVGTVDDWEWNGPELGFEALCAELGAPALARRAGALNR